VLTAPFLLTFPMILLGTAVYVAWNRIGLLVAAVLAGAVAFGVLVAVGLLTFGEPPAVYSTSLLVTLGIVFTAAGWLVVRRAPV